jgi:hypothetical protein
MFFEPLAGNRFVKVTDQRRRKDWAHAIQKLSEVNYPQAEKIVIVMELLNSHSPAPFYETFETEEARSLINRFEFHFTPKHGSRVNIAEMELGVIIRQCLIRCIADKATLGREVNTWQNERNANIVKVDWRFTTTDAWIKLKHLYPTISV